MSYDPNQPQQPDPNQQPEPPYGQPPPGQLQPPYQQPQPPYEQQQWGQQPPLYYEQPGQPQQPPYEQLQWGQQPPPDYAPTQYVAPAYGAPLAPGYMPPQQPGRSRRGLWIALGIIGGVLVLSCALCGILIALGAGPLAGIFGTVVGPTYTATQYYNAVKIQDYTTAFSYMEPGTTTFRGQPITQQAYTFATQTLDTLRGKVSSFSVGNISVTGNTTTVTVAATRGSNPPYNVHLQLQQVNGSWKIISLDNI